MALTRKIGGLCQVLLLAASVSALAAGAALAQEHNDLADLNEQILNNPQDVQLNLQYAHAAEAAGKPRLALAAYERVLINDPSNHEAREGYERVRRQIEPGYTVARSELGVVWDSDPLNQPSSFFFEPPESSTLYGKFMIANESELGGRRWRSIVNLDVEDNQDIDDLDYDYIGVQTGPIFYVGPHTALLPAIGGGASWLGGNHYYSEVNLGVTMEGRVSGASYWWRLRGGHRDYNTDHPFFFGPVADHGNYAELLGGVVRPNVLSERGSLVISPFVRWSNIEGGAFDFFLFDELSPGKYTEYGIDANYNYQLTDHLVASVGALARERNFAHVDRNDMYLSPQASLSVVGAFPCNCDIRLQYRHRDNDTDYPLADYQADQVSLALTARY